MFHSIGDLRLGITCSGMLVVSSCRGDLQGMLPTRLAVRHLLGGYTPAQMCCMLPSCREYWSGLQVSDAESTGAHQQQQKRI